ncbi:hypothetical protein Aglo02_10010 [Actinokineospora globicatena]|nr:hypothetical protein Aglo02_10010 [Actinokineospora globicatena]
MAVVVVLGLAAAAFVYPGFLRASGPEPFEGGRAMAVATRFAEAVPGGLGPVRSMLCKPDESAEAVKEIEKVVRGKVSGLAVISEEPHLERQFVHYKLAGDRKTPPATVYPMVTVGRVGDRYCVLHFWNADITQA